VFWAQWLKKSLPNPKIKKLKEKMQETTILKKIKEILAENFGIDPSEVTESAYFEEDLNVGEYEMVELLSELEEEYQIEFEGEEKAELITVGDLVSVVRDKAE
jgi:acyl carrier protein